MLQASPISHGAATLAYLVLAAVLFRSHGRGAVSGRRESQVDTIWWVQAAVLTAAWAGAVACTAWRTSDWGHVASAVETLRNGGWLLLLMRLREAGRPAAIVPAAPRRCAPGARWQRLGWLPALAMLPLLAQAMDAAAVLAILRLLLAVAGLVLVELLFRAAPLHARWGVRLASDSATWPQGRGGMWDVAGGMANSRWLPANGVRQRRQDAGRRR